MGKYEKLTLLDVLKITHPFRCAKNTIPEVFHIKIRILHSVFNFYATSKHPKNRGFLIFPGSIVIKHWLEMGKNTLQTSVHFLDHLILVKSLWQKLYQIVYVISSLVPTCWKSLRDSKRLGTLAVWTVLIWLKMHSSLHYAKVNNHKTSDMIKNKQFQYQYQ